MMINNPRLNPFVGPRAFEQDEPFYGRDREVRELSQLLGARRIVLLHAPSGAGKTSLVRAGLLPNLNEEGFNVLPVCRLNHEPPNDLSTFTGFNRYLFSLLLSLEEPLEEDQKTPVNQLANRSLPNYLERYYGSEEESELVVLIIDQLEEILTADPTDTRSKEFFFAKVGEALRNPNLWALFVIREDYMGALEPYVRAIPTRLANTYRLDLLKEKGAWQAIQKPCRDVGVDFTEPAAAKLVDDLRRIRVQQPDGSFQEVPGPHIEPVQLQVVCYRLWQDLAPDKMEITEADLVGVGDVNQSLAEYYDERVSAIAAETGVRERAIRNWFDRQLITSGGVRSQVLSEPKESGGLDNQAIHNLQDSHLVRSEKRSGATWFELAHDRLVEPVRQSNAIWRRESLSLLQRQAALWIEQGRPEGLLITGSTLTEAIQWARDNPEELTKEDEEFLNKSRHARARQEQALALEKETLRAESERQRAEEQAEMATRLRTRFWLLAGVGTIAVIFCLCAVVAVVASGVLTLGIATSQSQVEDAQEQVDQVRQEAEQNFDIQNTAIAIAADGAAATPDANQPSGILQDDPDAASTATSVALQSDVIVANANATAYADAPEQTAEAAAAALDAANATAEAIAINSTATSVAVEATAAVVIANATATAEAAVGTEASDILPGQIAFVSDRNGDDSIYIMEVAGDGRSGAPWRVTQTSGYDWWPTWCVWNGSIQIAFERGDDPWNTQRTEVVMITPGEDESGRQITSDALPEGSAMNGLPSCSNDGRMLAFSSRAVDAPGNDFKLGYTTEDAKAFELIGDGYSLAGNVGWSPKDESVVFMHYSKEKGRFHIYRVDRNDASTFDNLTEDVASTCKYPAWSPSQRGTRIAFACSNTEGDKSIWSLYLYDELSRNPEPRVVVPNLHVGSERDRERQLVRHAITPTWSPDGQWIAFSSDIDGDYDIYIYSLETGLTINLTDDSSSDEFHPSWGPE